jgi:hypothetical protein
MLKSASCAAGFVLVASAFVFSQSCPGPADCLSFSAAQLDQVTIPSPGSGALDGFAGFTIECRMKSSASGLGTLVSKWRQLTTGQTPYLIRMATSKIQVYFTNGFVVTGTVTVNDDVWHHVAVTRTGSSCQLIIDGVLDTAFTYAPVLNTTTSPLVFGSFLDVNDIAVAGTHYDGLLDEVRIWNVGRSIAQIQSTMNQALPGGTPNLVGAWRFDAGSGQIVADESSTGAQGFLGTSSAPAANDPSWSAGTGSLLGYPCSSVIGASNSMAAALYVNGAGAAPLSGPFAVNLAGGGLLTLTWGGPAGQPFILLAGTSNPANTSVPGLGILDIGAPPTFGDITIVFDGTQGTGTYFYTLGAGGTATQTYTLPPTLPAGAILSIQGLVLQPVGATPFGVLLTAAFRLIG